jgi:hypothetical protein
MDVLTGVCGRPSSFTAFEQSKNSYFLPIFNSEAVLAGGVLVKKAPNSYR